MGAHLAGKTKVILQRNPKIAREMVTFVRMTSDFTGDPFGRGIGSDSEHVRREEKLNFLIISMEFYDFREFTRNRCPSQGMRRKRFAGGDMDVWCRTSNRPPPGPRRLG